MSTELDFIEPEEKPAVRWFADDFETTTDLDGEPQPYELSEEDIESLETLEVGETRLSVARNNVIGAYTVSATKHADGTYTATYRTGRVRVWSWAIAPLDEDVIYTGTTIESYVNKAAHLGGVHWFHNLRFDGAFLDAYLCTEEPIGLGMSSGKWRTRHVPKGCFGALISDQGAHYSRGIHLADGRRFEVRDSLKKFPNASVADLAGMYGAPVSKGEIDYTAERPAGYEPTAEEWDYIKADVAIVRTALQVPEAIGNTGLTIGSDAMTEYRTSMPGRFRTVFPLLDRSLDEWIRKAYRGGWTWVNPVYQGMLLGTPTFAKWIYDLIGPMPGVAKRKTMGSSWDVNSMYPAVMRRNSFPVGEPVRLPPGQTELKGYPHTIVGALLDAKIKPGRFPMVQVKGDARYDPVTYQTEVQAIEWFGTEIDWALLLDQYDVEIHEWIGGFAFRGMRGLFNRYIDKWMQVKASSTGGMRTQAKYALNNLWGRFAINPLRAGRLPLIDEDGVVKYQLTPQQYDEPAYTPVGVYTTSYARDRVIRAAQSFGPRFLAADTDSCHVIGTDPGDLEVHDSKLGAWKREAIFDQATYLRAKAYAERIVDHGEPHVEAHVAGLPRKLLKGARVEDITIGTKYSGKLVPRRVPGGVILVSTDFAIGERDGWGHRS
jgi:DNA polymerase type B, organellar and viral